MKAGIRRLAIAWAVVGQTGAVALVLLGLGVVKAPPVAALQLAARSLQISSAVPGDTVRYNLSLQYATVGTLGSIQFEFCQNDPLIGTACTAPPGLDLTAASLVDQTGETGFSIHASSTANKLVLSRPPTLATTQPSSYVLDGVVNPTATGTHYVRIQTFASDDASGPELDRGGLAFSINPAFQVSTEVPPYLEFCTAITIVNHDCSTASGNTVDFGELSRSQTSTAVSQFMAVTNASSGYGVTLAGTTMTAGNEVIPAVVNSVSVPGLSQFGLNLRANSLPPVGNEPAGSGSAAPLAAYDQPNRFSFGSGDTIAAAIGASDFQTFTTSYIVNVSADQAPGQYAATLSYICLANF